MSATNVNALVIIGGIGVFAVLLLIMVLVVVQPSSGSSWTPAQRAEQTRTCLINESGPSPDGRAHKTPDEVCSCWVAYVEARIPYSDVDNLHPSTKYRTVSREGFDTCDP